MAAHPRFGEWPSAHAGDEYTYLRTHNCESCMNCPNYYSHKGAEDEIRSRNAEWLFSLYNTPNISVEPKGGAIIRDYTRQCLTANGWSGESAIHNKYDLT